MKRLSVLAVFLLLLALSVSKLVVGQTADHGAMPLPDHLTLTWTGDTATTMTITWRTDTSVTTGLVQYQAGPELTPKATEVTAVPREFATDLGTVRLFTATLTGLTANTKYAYRVGGGEQWSSAHAFSTADPQARAFKFLVFGDSQSAVTGKASYAVWQETVQKAFKAHPDAKFMVNVGDLVDVGQSAAHWNAWFTAAAGVVETIPQMPVVGNHETSGLPGSRKPLYWNTQFPLPQNGPEGLKNQAYSYDVGPVHIAVLDSQQDEQKAYGDILTPQRTWLDADLAASTARWKIAFFHKPPYSLKDGRDNAAVKAAFCPTLEQHGVDLVFSAHDHGVSRTHAMKGDAVMEKASQGTTYFVTGRSGSKVYRDIEKRAWNAFFYNPQDQTNYLVVEVADMKLTVNSFKLDGTLVDSYVIDKEAP